MTEKAKAMRAEYLKRWKKNNPEKQKQYRERYWEKMAIKADLEKSAEKK